MKQDNVYIMVKGGRRVDLTNREITWTTINGTKLTGRVKEFGRYNVGNGLHAWIHGFLVESNDETYFLRVHEMRDIAAKLV